MFNKTEKEERKYLEQIKKKLKETIKQIKLAEADIREGRVYSIEEVKKELGL